MRLIDADALKEHKVYSAERHEKVVPVANIDWMPTVDAAPVKHGRWVDAMVGELPVQVCDQCNTFFPLAYTGGGHHYCPNCGAKMDMEEHNGTDNP